MTNADALIDKNLCVGLTERCVFTIKAGGKEHKGISEKGKNVKQILEIF